MPAAPPRTAHRASVSLQNGLMTVTASNSSLNQVIREIARQTGMHVTGYVAEDRVFGTYGPAEPAAILATLLDGTGSNLLIVQNSADLPKQLILTPRTGAPTPPDPNAAAESAAEAGPEEQPVPPFAARRGQPNPSNIAPPAGPSRNPAQDVGGIDRNPSASTSPSTIDQTVVFPPIDPSTPSATGTSSPLNGAPSNTTPAPTDPAASPADDQDNDDKAVKTPQQIFQELQKLQQKPPQ